MLAGMSCGLLQRPLVRLSRKLPPQLLCHRLRWANASMNQRHAMTSQAAGVRPARMSKQEMKHKLLQSCRWLASARKPWMKAQVSCKYSRTCRCPEYFCSIRKSPLILHAASSESTGTIRAWRLESWSFLEPFRMSQPSCVHLTKDLKTVALVADWRLAPVWGLRVPKERFHSKSWHTCMGSRTYEP